MWFLLLLTYSFSLPSTSEAFSCHKCASERAVMNWSRYGLPMQQGDSMEGDDSCLHEEKLQDGVHCPGLCMTVNVTAASGPHIGKSIGIVRDCQPPVAKKKHDLKEGQNETCVTHQRTVRSNYVVNVTYCYCAGEYCNGGSSSPTQDGTVASSESRRISGRRSSRRRAPNSASALPYFLPLILASFL